MPDAATGGAAPGGGLTAARTGPSSTTLPSTNAMPKTTTRAALVRRCLTTRSRRTPSRRNRRDPAYRVVRGRPGSGNRCSRPRRRAPASGACRTCRPTSPCRTNRTASSEPCRLDSAWRRPCTTRRRAPSLPVPCDGPDVSLSHHTGEKSRPVERYSSYGNPGRLAVGRHAARRVALRGAAARGEREETLLERLRRELRARGLDAGEQPREMSRHGAGRRAGALSPVPVERVGQNGQRLLRWRRRRIGEHPRGHIGDPEGVRRLLDGIRAAPGARDPGTPCR